MDFSFVLIQTIAFLFLPESPHVSLSSLPSVSLLGIKIRENIIYAVTVFSLSYESLCKFIPLLVFCRL